MGEYRPLSYISVQYNEWNTSLGFLVLFCGVIFCECEFCCFFFFFLFNFFPFFVCFVCFFSFCYRDKLQWWKQRQEFTVDIFYIVRRIHSFLERGPKFFISKIPPLLTFTPVKEFCLVSLILCNWHSHEWHFSSKQSQMKKNPTC